MSNPVAVKMIGLGEFKAQLKRISGSVRGDMLAVAGIEGVQLMVNPAKAKAPKRTGNLKRSITTEVLTQTDNYAEVAIGTNLEYAAIQEFGGIIAADKAKVFGRPLGREIRIPPHPYLRPAWDEYIDKAITEIKKSLVKLITQAASV